MKDDQSDTYASPTALQDPIIISDAFPSDLTITTIDGTEIQVHKVMLSLHSTVFRDMFIVGGGAQDQVSVTENRHTMDWLLRFCYPGTDPVIDFRGLWSVLCAARKYMMSDVETRVLDRLKYYIQGDPWRAYALACRDGFEAEAKDAALASLTVSAIPGYIPELEEMSAGAMLRLLQFRTKCVDQVMSMSSEWEKERGFVFHACDVHDESPNDWQIGAWVECVGVVRELLRKTPWAGVIYETILTPVQALAHRTCETCNSRHREEFVVWFVNQYSSAIHQATSKMAKETSFTSR
ncbi:hypothetical protein NEOLEDRAFT_1181603 [Neolentinus lepideus HHB14362 ss-1]|uniref:BTB domain-containing protein n=1 Tax=Neolentinus lepideus HHB14362 ss-1 TaxID=1314782 RepID=A0A165PWT8_9AGAM|nr:hypothetical protein NEOLEDRAFT_1181603 [Neolentinus lepideus HHB14362 ss-1]